MPRVILPDGTKTYFHRTAPWFSFLDEDNPMGHATAEEPFSYKWSRQPNASGGTDLVSTPRRLEVTWSHARGIFVHYYNLYEILGEKTSEEIAKWLRQVLIDQGYCEERITQLKKEAYEMSWWSSERPRDSYVERRLEASGTAAPWVPTSRLEREFKH